MLIFWTIEIQYKLLGGGKKTYWSKSNDSAPCKSKKYRLKCTWSKYKSEKFYCQLCTMDVLTHEGEIFPGKKTPGRFSQEAELSVFQYAVYPFYVLDLL